MSVTMASSEKEHQKQLTEAGNQLLSPPDSVSELLAALDRVESLLTRVEQSPSEAMKEALSPSMKALITNELLRHSNIDVKVAVASCISEITRITAPDAPYEDDQMKEVFQLIVSSFEKLDDTSSPSYIKRTSILETVAKVRSCVVMLDLECDALIADMFQHFFKSIRSDHPENVFSSMETIMTLVLEESEEISVDLLSSILDVLKTENKDILPIARQLGEKVTEKCAGKLKPYLLPVMKSRGTSADDYSKVVADVFQAGNKTVEPSAADAASKNVGDESDVATAPSEKAVEVALDTLDDAPPSEEVGPATIGSPKSVVTNGNIQKEIEDTSAGDDDSKVANHVAQDEEAEPSKIKEENSDAEELTKLRTKSAKSSKRRGKKKIPLKSSSQPSESAPTDEKEGVETPEPQGKDAMDVDNVQSEAAATDSAEPTDNEKESEAPVPSPKASDEPVGVPSPSPSGSLADENCIKIVGPRKKKDELVEIMPPVDADLNKESDTKKSPEGDGGSESKLSKHTEEKLPPAADKEDSMPNSVDVSNEEGEKTSELNAKSAKQLAKKVEVSRRKDKKDNVPSSADVSKEEDEKTSELDAKSAKQLVKKVEADSRHKDEEDSAPSSTDASKEEDEKTNELDAKSAKQLDKKVEIVSSRRKDKKKQGQGKVTPAKDLAKTPSREEGKKSVGSAKSTAKSVKDESDSEKASKSSSKRKRSNEKKVPKYGKELVGSKVQVWWPDDKKFYDGVIEHYDPASGKHKVSYTDGDIEVLKLEKEKWKLIEDDSVPEQGHSSDDESPDESAETPKAKKAKTSPVQATKRGKAETSAKKAGASTSKSKGTPKSRTKQKDDSKEDDKEKDETLKSIGKTKDSKPGNKTSDKTSKSAGKSKDNDVDTPKGSSKSKQETPKGASKSKSKSSKSGSKSNTNSGGSKVKSASPAKEEDSEDMESSPEPAKAPETSKAKSPSASKSQKSAKKRKRGTKG